MRFVKLKFIIYSIKKDINYEKLTFTHLLVINFIHIQDYRTLYGMHIIKYLCPTHSLSMWSFSEIVFSQTNSLIDVAHSPVRALMVLTFRKLAEATKRLRCHAKLGLKFPVNPLMRSHVCRVLFIDIFVQWCCFQAVRLMKNVCHINICTRCPTANLAPTFSICT